MKCRFQMEHDRKVKGRTYQNKRYHDSNGFIKEYRENNKDLVKVRKIEDEVIREYQYSYMDLVKMSANQNEACYLCGKITDELYFDVNVQLRTIDGAYCAECRDKKQPLKLYKQL